MEKPVKTEKLEPEVKILAPEQAPQREEQIVLDSDSGKPVETPTQTQPAISQAEFEKMQRRMEYQARQYERSMRDMQATIEGLKQNIQPVRQTETPKVSEYEFPSDLNERAQNRWQDGVVPIAETVAEKIAEKKIRAILEEREKKQYEAQTLLNRASQIEASKNRVLKKHPELNDESSDKFQEYVQVLNENPDLRDNPRGPELLMYEMEERLRSKTSPNTQEAERLKRVAAGTAPVGRTSAGGKKTFTLTQEEIDMCERAGLSPKAYAQAKEANLKEGVSA